jgi:hydroxymethylbilane synthase
LRPDLDVQPLRGNLDTRLRKLDEGGYDAIVLAAAGLVRLGLASRIRSLFEPGEMLPAAGQGALGIELRSDAHDLRERLATLNHRATWLAVLAERAVSRTLGGSCSVPLAAHAVWQGEDLRVDVLLGHPEQHDRPLLRASVVERVGDDAHADPRADAQADARAEALGVRAAKQLIERGARGYLDAAEAPFTTTSTVTAPGPAASGA